MQVEMYESIFLWKRPKTWEPTGAGLMDGCEPPNMGEGTELRFLARAMTSLSHQAPL